MNSARLVGWSGAVVVVLTIASLGVLPAAAGMAASQQDRTSILASAVLGGLAWSGAFVVFVAALQAGLRARQDETTALLSSVGFAGGILNAAVIVLSVFFLALGAFRARDAASLALAQDGSFLANSFTGFATAVCVGGFSPALRRVGFPSWLLALAVAVGAHHLASTVSLATDGLWSPSGPVTLSAPLGMTLWVGCVAALAWRRGDRL